MGAGQELVREWVSLEKGARAFSERGDLTEVMNKVREYLEEQCMVLSNAGAIFAFGDFRTLLWENFIKKDGI